MDSHPFHLVKEIKPHFDFSMKEIRLTFVSFKNSIT